MRYRIATWASAGMLVAVGWAVYACVTTAPAMTSADPIMALVELTCPIVFVGMHFTFGISLSWSLVANAATYAMLGLIVESMRQRPRQAR